MGSHKWFEEEDEDEEPLSDDSVSQERKRKGNKRHCKVQEEKHDLKEEEDVSERASEPPEVIVDNCVTTLPSSDEKEVSI